MQALDDIGVDRALRLERDFGEQVLDEFLELIRHHLELAQISYAGSVFPGPAMSGVALSLIQGGRCVPSFRDARLVFIEVMLALRVRSAVPLDWAELAKGDPKLRRLFDEARDAGFGRQGLTIPVLGKGNTVCALLNATSDESDGVWDARRLELTRDLMRIAHFVHQRACDHYVERKRGQPGRRKRDAGNLSAREIEALQGAADGREPAEIAGAMRVSSAVVTAYLESARYKLQALNNTHAIITALRAGWIR